MKIKIGKYKQNTEKRKFKLKTCPDDFFSLDSTLSLIIVKLLKEFKKRNNGMPFVYWEDVPEHFKEQFFEKNSDQSDCQDGANMLEAWLWVLDEMIVGFENIDIVEKRFMSGKIDMNFEPIKETNLYSLVKGPNDTFSFDKEGFEKYLKRMEKGRILFAKYFNCLWI